MEERLMPGTNAGTGYPLTFRCAKCKVGRDYKSWSHREVSRGCHYKLTGRTRDAKGVGYRQGQFKVEYECLDCGHIGWTQHIDPWHRFMHTQNLKEETK